MLNHEFRVTLKGNHAASNSEDAASNSRDAACNSIDVLVLLRLNFRYIW